ncbi:three component ABC system middle component [Actinosynnema sp. NPDC000082]|uniref:three component ABC system middle component n=1 Tax=Actinosynnema sp. NPDC000082 TaxID=3363910 RepID=UPI0036D0A90E
MSRYRTGRPPEEAALYNPAFLALLVRRAAEGTASENSAGISTFLAFVATTMSLRSDIRELLTMTVSSKLGSWTQEHARELTMIAPACRALIPYLNDALMFGLHYDLYTISRGRLHVSGRGPTKKISGLTVEVQECQRASYFLGRWFSLSGSDSTVAALLGVRP